MWRDLYIAEKLREIETMNEAHLIGCPLPKREPMVWPVIRTVGRQLRRAGEKLESWAAPDGLEGEASDIKL